MCLRLHDRDDAKNESGGLSFKFSEVGGPTMVGSEAEENF